jgi:hypothetical protein
MSRNRPWPFADRKKKRAERQKSERPAKSRRGFFEKLRYLKDTACGLKGMDVYKNPWEKF